MMVKSLFAVGLLLCFMHGDALKHFCAKVQVVEGSTINEESSGYFYAGIGRGIGIYDFSVDLSGVTNCDFEQYPEVMYHIHTNPVNDTGNPPEQVSCGNAGLHYDPNLACGEFSAAHATFCTALNRTAEKGFKYNCIPGVPVKRYGNPTGFCEVGDLSGKFGLVKVSPDKMIVPIANLTDFLPPYIANFRQPTPNITQGWASIVFHCGDPAGTRIACGDFGLICGIRRGSQSPSAKPIKCPKSC